jgi:FADH2 O2-dependent halogenase
MSKQRFQIAIVGSGFAGSLLAMMAKRLGYSVVLIERGRHPRFVIGESSTPVANLLLEEISVAYDLPFVRPLCKWGSWQRQLPHIGCGLKRGFTFYHHEFGKTFSAERESVTRSNNHGLEVNEPILPLLHEEVLRVTDPRSGQQNQLLVGASPNEEIADTHWYRPDFDQYLMLEAQKLGVVYLDETLLDSARETLDGMVLAGKRHGEPIEIAAEFVIDATGPRGRAAGKNARALSADAGIVLSF